MWAVLSSNGLLRSLVQMALPQPGPWVTEGHTVSGRSFRPASYRCVPMEATGGRNPSASERLVLHEVKQAQDQNFLHIFFF